LVDLYNILIIQVSSSIPRNLYNPFYPFLSLYTYISDCNDRFNIPIIFGPFLIVNIFLIWRFVFKYLSLIITKCITSTLLIINTKKILNYIIQGYIPKISNINTSPFRLVILFTILTTICKIKSLFKFSFLNSYYKILYI